MNMYALIYTVVEDYMARRPQYRADHLLLAREASERGELVLAGALGDPPDRALLIFRGEDASAAEAFAARDPYVRNGLVSHWEVQPWAVVIGG